MSKRNNQRIAFSAILGLIFFGITKGAFRMARRENDFGFTEVIDIESSDLDFDKFKAAFQEMINNRASGKWFPIKLRYTILKGDTLIRVVEQDGTTIENQEKKTASDTFKVYALEFSKGEPIVSVFAKDPGTVQEDGSWIKNPTQVYLTTKANINQFTPLTIQ